MQPVFIISGEKKSGKTTFLKELIVQLRQQKITAGGIIALHNMKTDTYSIENIATGNIVKLMTRNSPPRPWPDHFKIFQEGFDTGTKWLNECLKNPPSIIGMDEIGKFELHGMVWSNQFTTIIKSGIPLIFTVNTNHLAAVIEKWNLQPCKVFTANDFIDVSKATSQIKTCIREWI